jgi:hypothetical protein
VSSKRVKDPEVESSLQLPLRRVFLGVLGLALMNVACGSTVTRNARSKKNKQHFDAVELFPVDLDVVVRVDLERMRVALGPLADGLSSRVESEIDVHDELAAKAIERARVAWIGTRLADVELGDRVLVVEGDVDDLRPDSALYQLLDPPLSDSIKTFERRGPLARETTARIHLLGAKTIVFVSGVEVDGVERVLLRGADPGRRDPPADGLVSADIRGRRLPPSLERKFPSIGSIVRGIERARASVTMVDDGLRAEFDMTTASDAASKKLDSFINALREGGQGSRYAQLFDGLHVERVERVVQMKWVVPIETLRKLVAP